MKRYFKIFAAIMLLLFTLGNECCTLIDKDGFGEVCESDCTVIQGKFSTEIGEPAKNVALNLEWKFFSSPGVALSDRIRKIMRTRTDEEGNYKFVFHVKDEELTEGYFSITISQPDTAYIFNKSYSSVFFFGINKRDTVIISDYHLPKKGGEIEVRLKNPEAITGDDRVSAQIYYRYGGGRVLAGTLYSDVADNVVTQTAANQYTYLELAKKMNGQSVTMIDSVLVPINQKVIYEIEF